MDNLTPPVDLKDMTNLIPASQASLIANSAVLYKELASIAALINQAANTGEKSVWYNCPISDQAKSILESDEYGYTVSSVKDSAKADSQYIISWEM